MVDLQLSDLTVKGHIIQMRRFLKTIKKHPLNITSEDLRDHLITYRDKSSSTYANVLKALKVFFRDFMKKAEAVHSFKFPKKPIKIRQMPSKEELQRFYHALPSLQDKAAFMMYATTGLRRDELLSLKIKEIGFNKRMVIPNKGMANNTKHTGISFYNEETKKILSAYISGNNLHLEERLFPIHEVALRKVFKKAFDITSIKITPRVT